METSKGTALLRDYCGNRGYAFALAARIGVHQGTLSHWVTGGRTPCLRYAIALRDALGIPIESWSQPAKPARQRKAASHV